MNVQIKTIAAGMMMRPATANDRKKPLLKTSAQPVSQAGSGGVAASTVVMQ